MSTANFAARFDGFSGERFEMRGQRAGPRDAVVVESAIVRPDDDPVELDYVLREGEAGWRIIDVLLDGKYSELAKQRSEFAALLAERRPARAGREPRAQDPAARGIELTAAQRCPR